MLMKQLIISLHFVFTLLLPHAVYTQYIMWFCACLQLALSMLVISCCARTNVKQLGLLTESGGFPFLFLEIIEKAKNKAGIKRI